jgi:hypothetical protein
VICTNVASAACRPSAPSPIAHVTPSLVVPSAALPSVHGSPHHIARSATIGRSVEVALMPYEPACNAGSSAFTSTVRRDCPVTSYALLIALPSCS